MKLVEIRKTKLGELPFTRNTIYKFSSEKKYPSVILTIGRKLFFDLDAWEDLVEQTRERQVAEASHLRREG